MAQLPPRDVTGPLSSRPVKSIPIQPPPLFFPRSTTDIVAKFKHALVLLVLTFQQRPIIDLLYSVLSILKTHDLNLICLHYWKRDIAPGYSVRSWCDGSSDRSLMVDPIRYLMFQTVLYVWWKKPLWYVLSCLWDMHIKEPLLLIEKSSPCSGGNGFALSVSI